MSHDKYEMMASRAADGEISATEALELDKHLATCDGCREFARDIKLMRRTLMAESPTTEPSSALVGLLVAKAVEVENKPVGWFGLFRRSFIDLRPVMTYTFAALLIGAVVGGVGFRLQEQHKPRVEFSKGLTHTDEELFKANYPGAISDVLDELGKGAL